MQALPALAERDLPRFGAAITEMQARLGDYFAPAQGGARFTSRDVGAVLDRLDAQGAHRHRAKLVGADRLCVCAHRARSRAAGGASRARIRSGRGSGHPGLRGAQSRRGDRDACGADA